MVWKVLADVSLVVHAFWVAAAFLGPLWAVKNSSLRIVHLILLWGTFLISASGAYCPLTVIETSLRMHYDPSAAYAGSFLSHYLSKLASWNVQTHDVCVAITVWTLMWTVVYGWLWARAVSPRKA
ncbi:MAG: DUF2784 family protein [Elusimicrobia bacterium]|nr:DUF2784 family protein [Elusimicrobiota bacterium]